MAKVCKHCLECGTALEARKTKGAELKFCSPAHRKTFNNRRMTRGGEMYDYVMSGRFERGTHAGIWREALTVMATHFRDKDKSERDGRQSWHTPDVLGDPRALTR